MKVWIVSGGWHHEDCQVLAVFSTEEKARAFCEVASGKRYDFLLLESGVVDGPFDEASLVYDKDADPAKPWQFS